MRITWDCPMCPCIKVSVSPWCFISWHGMIYEASLVFTKTPATCESQASCRSPRSPRPLFSYFIEILLLRSSQSPRHHPPAGKNKPLGVPIKTIKFNNCIQMKYWNFKHEATGFTVTSVQKSTADIRLSDRNDLTRWLDQRLLLFKWNQWTGLNVGLRTLQW